MKGISRILFVIISLTFSILTWAQTSYSELYVFGDSLSDNGNFTFYNGSLPLPYDSNRVTNATITPEGVVDSAVAVEVLASQLGIPLTPATMNGTNYAFVGAKASSNDPGDLASQIGAFALAHTTLGVPYNPDNALFVMFIGGNDVRAARDADSFIEARNIIKQASTKVNKAVLALIGMGAQHIMVVNSPDIGKIPETDLLAVEQQNPWLPLLATWRSQQFNSQLFFKLLATQWITKKDIVQVNLFKILNGIIANADQYGFINSQDACVVPVPPDGIFHPDCEDGLKAPLFVFFDPIHPSTHSHALIGQALASQL